MAERAQIISTNVGGHRLTREEQRKQRDLETARKAGTAPAAVDSQSGNSINPHIPDYISKAPWYADIGVPSLAHQRHELKASTKLDQWYERGQRVGTAAKKFRKGACENCGAMTHKRADCVERPRKRGAKYSGKDIMADELVQDIEGDYDAKRDRWNGYDPSTYKHVVDEYEAMESARKKIREEEMDKAAEAGEAGEDQEKKKKAKVVDDEFGSSDESEEDEEKYAEAAEQVGQKLDEKNRITVRNLRIREDTAKYLINLNPESAYYDPKTRAMRDAPEEGAKDQKDMKFAGDNFTRFSGEATNMAKLQTFAWQSNQRGHNVHIEANPTAASMLHREFTEKKGVMKDTNRVSILEKYGGEEHLERLPQELLQGQTEEYVEYSRTGNVLKGRERAKAQSKYEEDVHPNNHTSVWGSYFDRSASSWGYSCCHSTLHNSYCVGEAGKAAVSSSSVSSLLASAADRRRIDAEAEVERRAAAMADEEKRGKTLVERHQEELAKSKDSRRADERRDKDKDRDRDRDARDGKEGMAKRVEVGDEVDLDRDRLKKALDLEKKRKGMADDDAWQQTKKGKTDVTQEELEAYRLSKQAYDDPMANYKDTDE